MSLLPMPIRMAPGLSGQIILALLVVYLGGCATYSQQAVSMRDSLLTGRADLAKIAAESKDKNQDDVLASLNKGMLRRMTGDYVGSNQILEVAKQKMEALYGVSVTDTAASLTINDAVRDYRGARYEQILLHAYMAMNYLQLGEPDSARVEMLQADVKMREWGEQTDENPFVRYFSGMIYEALGENDQALVSYRKARAAYQTTAYEMPMEVPQILNKDMLRLLLDLGLSNEYRTLKAEPGMSGFEETTGPDSGELIVILNNGLAPIKTESSIMTFSSEVQGHVRVAFPVYRHDATPAKRARLRIGEKALSMQTVVDIDRLARRALDDEMPLIMSRAIARAVVKYQSQKSANDQSALAGFLLTVTNLATERADTRSWTTLPQEIQIARVVLPAGKYNVSIEIVNAAGRVADSIEAEVDILAGQHRFLTRHWVAPVPLKTQIATGK